MLKIVIITSGQPSLNPRLVKEADALASNGFKVTVIYQYLSEWATSLDYELLKDKNWKAIRVGGGPKEGYFTYLRSRIIYRMARFLITYFGSKGLLVEMALSRSTNALIAKAKSIPASLYIAHNLGALPAAVLASKKNKAKCGFDAEDFHRQEVTDDRNSKAFQIVKLIEDKYLPAVNYLTAASPHIGKAYHEIYPTPKPAIINNVFSKTLLQKVIPVERKELKLFWFSQTIGKGRGIEDAIKAISLLKKKHITLSLLGNIDGASQAYFLSLANDSGLGKNQLNFIPPIAASEIFALAAQYDIGLALEQAIPLNRDICLTNKIFTYLTAGLAIVASETQAQKDFLEHYPKSGMSYPLGNIEILSNIIDAYDHDRQLLLETKLNCSCYAEEKLNWEEEQVKLLEVVNQTLAQQKAPL
ncbi:hypothetical protein WG904_00265 [Pedobacter sp. Du54]|uniref:hypothetical protein n=1 Tax=Pedobacter anseongensis TaxID=3133439 RepID=UPI0030B2BF9A